MCVDVLQACIALCTWVGEIKHFQSNAGCKECVAAGDGKGRGKGGKSVRVMGLVV